MWACYGYYIVSGHKILQCWASTYGGAFPASCIANNTPQFKSATGENLLIMLLSVAIFVVYY